MQKIDQKLSDKKDFWKLRFLSMAGSPPYNLSLSIDQVNRMPDTIEPVLNLQKKRWWKTRSSFIRSNQQVR